MLKQTFESHSSYRTISLNGQFVNLGSFEDLVYKKVSENIVQINLELNLTNILRKIKFGGRVPLGFFLRDINFGQGNSRERILELEISLKFEKGKKAPMVEKYRLKAKTRIDNSLNEFNEGTVIEFEKTDKDEYLIKWNKLNFPNLPKFSTTSKSLDYFTEGHFKEKVSFVNMIPEIIIEDKESEHFFQLNRAIRSMREILFGISENIIYIGPLREEPSRRYIFEAEYVDIGNRGENAPFILATEGDNQILPYYYLNIAEGEWQQTQGTLKEGVNRWLKYMEISEKYDLVTQQEILRLYLPINQPINDKEVNVTLADVGFGVSQILPILVEGLRIQPNQTLILEQPEIHLHPKLQMQLADFFISMILSGKRILLETHSDHIINRIVRRIIENEENEISSKINILFFEVGENGSKPRNVEIDSDRGIINWPKGFFDQSAIEKKTIIQSGIERRKKIIRE
jgi:predicted ATPase